MSKSITWGELKRAIDWEVTDSEEIRSLKLEHPTKEDVKGGKIKVSHERSGVAIGH